MSRRELLQLWERRFAAQGLDSPRLSAQVLLAHVLRMERFDLLLNLNVQVRDSELKAFVDLAARREFGEPVAYLTGHREFYGLDLLVTSDVLIPRPETELIVDQMRGLFAANEALSIVDIGTGSGALAITCAICFPRSRVVGVDISRAALRIARLNAERLGVADRIDFVQADLVDSLRLSSFGVLLANLPYVPTRTASEISPEVQNFEPHVALFAGEDGLDCYRRLARQIGGDAPDAVLFCEIDPGQGGDMRALFTSKAREIDIFTDHSGLDRLVRVVF